jgi:hypothetical protein
MSRLLLRNDDVRRLDGFTRRDFIRLSLAAAVAAGIGGQGMTRKAWAQNEFLPSPLETRILGANTILSGSKASLRIVTVDHRDGSVVKGAGVRVSLVTPDVAQSNRLRHKETTLFKGYTNKRGTVDANFQVPKLDKGDYEVIINTSSSIGTDSFRSTISVTESAQVLLTTDKPLYQPNQTIHIRALALARPDLKPVAEKPLTFEVEDSKGNKVFKKEVTTSKFGVASAEFVLGHEINMGRYTVRTVMGDAINEKKVTVDKYVLPKFKVNVTTDKKYYLPGQIMEGTVQVDYFFGKPVAGGEVTVRLAKFDVGFNEFAELKGTTDENGTYKFHTNLPDSFVGLPLEQGNALVKLDVSVMDKAEHREKVTHTVPVAKDAVKITVVPESGALIPGVENTIYILTNYPDGAPAPCRFNLKSKGIDLSGSTDKIGIGEVKLTPKAEPQKADAAGAGGALPPPVAVRRGRGGFAGPMGDDVVVASPMPEGPPLEVTVTAQDSQGNKGSTTTQIARRVTDESLLLRTDKAVGKVGDSLTVELISTRQSGTAYVDIVKDKQTVLTQSVDMSQGRGTLRVNLDESLSGTIQAHAYLITPRGDIVRDTKIVYVNPANDLKISVKADKETYQPGAPAKLNLKVTDERGHPVLAALGIQIVDESVFALQEMQPGMEKVYFTLEKELLEPKVEVHGFTPEGVVPLADETPRLNPEKQKVAKVLFAAAQPVVDFGINHNSFVAKQQAVAQKWYERVAKDAQKFGKALDAYRKKHSKFPAFEEAVNELLDEKLITRDDLKDPLGTPYDIRPRFNAKDFNNGFLFISAGIDKKMNTDDDVRLAGYPGGQVGPVWGQMIRRRGRGGEELEFQEVMPPPMAAMPGMGGGGFGDVRAQGMPMERGAVADNMVMLAKGEGKALAYGKDGGGGEEPVRVRQFFPETLFVHPNVITDERGNATVSLNMADSITTWRMTALASSLKGELGSTTSPMRVFQDFFVDIDLPVALTQNDEVSIPVAVYNYLPQKQTVRLKLETESQRVNGSMSQWFELVNDSAEKSVDMDANQVGVVYYRLRVKEIGNHKLTVTARGTKLSDAIQRTIEVMPDGKEIWETVNDRLEGDVAKTMVIPAAAIDGGSNILVRIYPGAFSQVVDGLDKILRMPFG